MGKPATTEPGDGKSLLLLLSLSALMVPIFLSATVAAQPATPGPPSPPGDVSAAANPSLPRDFTLPIPLFSPGSAWNQTATAAAVLAQSDQQILDTYRVLRGDTTSLVPAGEPATTWPFVDINYDEFAIPISRAGAGRQSVVICDYEGFLSWPGPKWPVNEEGGPVSVPAPAGIVRPSGPRGIDSDGHLVLYDPATFTEYDFWQATTVRDGECESRGGGLTGNTLFEAGAADFFNVQGAGVNPDDVSSARATGTPLLAGMILPEDVAGGAIAHALAFAIPSLRNTSSDPWEPLASDYFYPVSTTETDFYSTSPSALAAGQRIRLKESIVDEEGEWIDEDELAPITRMFLTALRTYGAYVVDNAGGFTFYAEDIHTAVLDLSDAEVNTLIGKPSAASLPASKTKWQLVIENLNDELELIPFAYGPWQDGQNPATARITTANYEVVEPARPDDGGTEPCTSGATAMCLNQERFQVGITWRDFEGNTGSGRVVPVGSDDSGLFWFFDSDNWELLVKVLDGCAVNDRYWVFAAATTNVAYTLTVTDSETGLVMRYSNPLGVSAPAITDATAFATCP
ncbi:MAG: hypothetical protein GY856_19395 [bacterium]|nr:hypothetical protein [bacterium]